MASSTSVARKRSRVPPGSTGAATHRAGKPRNEDSVQVTRVGDSIIALVADGISGGELGNVMSALAIEQAVASLRAASPVEPRAALEPRLRVGPGSHPSAQTGERAIPQRHYPRVRLARP